MFNKKKIELLSNDVSDLNKKIEDLKSSLNNILDTLEGDNFSKDWEEYQKYKEIKDKLPSIEDMFQIKELKRLIAERDEYIVLEKETKKKIIEFELKNGPVDQAEIHETQSMRWGGAMNPRFGYKEILHTIDDLNKKTQSILKQLSDRGNEDGLIEVFKLYGISTEWLKP